MVNTVVLIVVLVLCAMALIVAEICTPMFGLLGVLALGCVAWAVYLCYTINGVLGVAATVAAVVGLPVYIVIAVKTIPKTRLGRILSLKRDAVPPGEGTPEAGKLQRFVGRIGTAETVLRPSGMVRIDEQRFAAQSESGMIEQGSTVKVIRATGMSVVVRKVEEQPAGS